MIAPAVSAPAATAFRALIAAAAATGLVIECAYGSVPVVLSYFTIWTNILVAIVFGISALRSLRRRPPLPAVWTGGVLLFILITGLVFHLVLANRASPFNTADAVDRLTGARAVANQLLHTVTPIGAFLDFALFTAPRALTARHALRWLAFPAAYLVFALVRGALLPPDAPSRYPYPFLDAARYGYAEVAATTAVLGAAFYALGLALVAADRHRPAPPRSAAAPAENRISSPAEGPLK
ncbi:Pr6Pr family membrane protein [Streptomyces sp. NPDC091268]|uniref:Pr6Pr family membrane protein n=1 Tax=Streptomyces sp. NPDC091268 TaxID=3365979 RepID=UPI003801A8F0